MPTLVIYSPYRSHHGQRSRYYYPIIQLDVFGVSTRRPDRGVSILLGNSRQEYLAHAFTGVATELFDARFKVQGFVAKRGKIDVAPGMNAERGQIRRLRLGAVR